MLSQALQISSHNKLGMLIASQLSLHSLPFLLSHVSISYHTVTVSPFIPIANYILFFSCLVSVTHPKLQAAMGIVPDGGISPCVIKVSAKCIYIYAYM
ncbi:hypothetical protein EON63_01940 [archaeon]|nr:MAG: hypothetical protein EON63_01940 [archaeon]